MDKITYDYKGYNITVQYIPHNGMYKISTLAYSMGDEYLESMLSDNYDKATLDKFIKRIEHNK